MPISRKWRLVVLGVFDHETEFIQKKERKKLLKKGDSAETKEIRSGISKGNDSSVPKDRSPASAECPCPI